MLKLVQELLVLIWDGELTSGGELRAKTCLRVPSEHARRCLNGLDKSLESITIMDSEIS